MARLVTISLLASPLIAQPIERGRVHVEDGDTIQVDSESFRLVGFDAPETGQRVMPPSASSALARSAG
jgi:endonuclease YncB( thermonuclease family)